MMPLTRMILIPFLFAISAYAFVSTASADQVPRARQLTPLTPLTDPNSFYNLSKASTRNEVNAKLSPACRASLRKHAAKPIRSSVLPSFLVPISDVPYQETADGLFYHYTDSQDVVDIVNAQKLGEIFSFLRTNPEREEPFLYIAGDETSSLAFGYHQIRIHISPKAKIFFPMSPESYKSKSASRDPLSTDMSMTNDVETEIFAEVKRVSDLIVRNIMKMDPSLKACENANVGTMDDSNILVLLALESERVPLISYFNTRIAWFHLMGTWAVDSMDVGR